MLVHEEVREGVGLLGRPKQIPEKTVGTSTVGRETSPLQLLHSQVLWELGTWAEALGLAPPSVGEGSTGCKPGLGTQEQLASLAWLSEPHLPTLWSTASSPKYVPPAASSLTVNGLGHGFLGRGPVAGTSGLG